MSGGARRRGAGARPRGRQPQGTLAYDRIRNRLGRRVWPMAVSVLYVVLGLVYTFRWGPVVRHIPSVWIGTGDLLSDYGTALQLATGHISLIYEPGRGFLAYPLYLVALLPLTLFNNAFKGFWVDVEVHHHVVAHPQVFVAPRLPPGFWYQGNLGPSTVHGITQVIHPQAFPYLMFLDLAYSCVALFACDALAERLQVGRARRAVLAVAEAVVLWNVSIIFGHPEDALAVGFAVYSIIFAMDGRFVGAGWLFGIALAFQPLALMMFPVLLAVGGRKRAVGLVARGVIPAAVVTAPPLATAFHDTVHALVDQPTFPDVSSAHQTPFTFLAPKLGGKGKGVHVGGGPPRVATFVVAAAFGVLLYIRRWRERPEMIAFALAVALALRVYFETVMYSYYVWPALAVALAVAARASRLRFSLAILFAVLTTVIGQWHLPWAEWWTIDVAGVTGLLVAASRPVPVPALLPARPPRAKPSAQPQAQRAARAPKKQVSSARASGPPAGAARSNGGRGAAKKAPASRGEPKRPVRS